jgi:hypothetical protein
MAGSISAIKEWHFESFAAAQPRFRSEAVVNSGGSQVRAPRRYAGWSKWRPPTVENGSSTKNRRTEGFSAGVAATTTMATTPPTPQITDDERSASIERDDGITPEGYRPSRSRGPCRRRGQRQGAIARPSTSAQI